MIRTTPRLWLGLGMAVLAGGPAFAAEAPACGKPVVAAGELGEAGEAGESGGEGGQAGPEARMLVLDRMAAQLQAGAAAAAAGETETDQILTMAALDEGPARLARGGGADQALEAELAPLAASPSDAAARRRAEAAVAAALARMPDADAARGRVERAAQLISASLEAYGAALDCNRLADRAAYAESRALAGRAIALLQPVTQQAAREMTEDLRRMLALLPEAPAAAPVDFGQLSGIASRALLAASDME